MPRSNGQQPPADNGSKGGTGSAGQSSVHSPMDQVPPTQPGPNRDIGAVPGRNGAGGHSGRGNREPPAPVNGGLPPPASGAKDAYSHLPPGIAASLERLAGTTGKRSGGGAGRAVRPPPKKRDNS